MRFVFSIRKIINKSHTIQVDLNKKKNELLNMKFAFITFDLAAREFVIFLFKSHSTVVYALDVRVNHCIQSDFLR